MSKNKNLHTARKVKNDEFYTRLVDIELELKHYIHHFKDKVIYCNCDNPKFSNFIKYFKDNFHILGIKKLLYSYYESGNNGGYGYFDGIEFKHDKFIYDGDFRCYESINLLEQCDIVVSNPPFSLFRDYTKQLYRNEKKFIIIGSLNAVTYKNIFINIIDNKLRLGINNVNDFLNESGDVISFGNINWYTNLDPSIKPKQLNLTKSYYNNPELYPKYDNYNAINCNSVKDIPYDYFGYMGVPITYIINHNPKQFRIVGQTLSHDESAEMRLVKTDNKLRHESFVKSVAKYRRFIIKRIDKP